MSTIYTFHAECPAETSFDDSADIMLVYDASEGRTNRAILRDVLGTAVTTESTAGGAISNRGVSVLSTAVGVNYDLAAPVAGASKIITALAVATAATRVVRAGSGVFIDSTTNNTLLSTGVQTVELIGVSSVRWQIVSNYSPTTGGMTLGST